MNLPNKLTVLRIILAPLYLILLLCDFPFHYLCAGLVFGAAALTDLFDGRLARSRGLITNLGKFLDPLADKMLTTAAFLGMMVTGHVVMWIWVLMCIFTREFMVTAIRLIAAKDGRVIAADFWGKMKTVMQYVAIIYMMVALEFSTWKTGLLAAATLPDAVFSVPLYIGYGLVWISVLFTMIAGVRYVWANRDYFRENGTT